MSKRYVVSIFVLAMLVGGCGAGPKTSLVVSMTDFAYNPNQLTVPAGEEIKLRISNEGAVVHNFIIMNAGAAIGQEYGAEDVANEYWKVEIQPGGATTTSFVAPSAPGDYLIVCSTAGHYIAGMTGKLIVAGP